MLVREYGGLRVWHWLSVVTLKFGTHFSACWVSRDISFFRRFDGPRFCCKCPYGYIFVALFGVCCLSSYQLHSPERVLMPILFK